VWNARACFTGYRFHYALHSCDVRPTSAWIVSPHRRTASDASSARSRTHITTPRMSNGLRGPNRYPCSAGELDGEFLAPTRYDDVEEYSRRIGRRTCKTRVSARGVWFADRMGSTPVDRSRSVTRAYRTAHDFGRRNCLIFSILRLGRRPSLLHIRLLSVLREWFFPCLPRCVS